MKLFYREYGEGNPIIIAHGLFGMSDNWIRIAKTLSVNFKVYVLDMRNHGQSPHNHIHTYKTMSNDLLEFINCLNIEKAIFIGHSMGGKAIMQFANDFPERINKMIVVDISSKAYHHNYDLINKAINHKELLKFLKDINLQKFKNRQKITEIVSSKFKNNFILQLIQKNITRNKDKKLSWKININALYLNLDKIKEEVILNKNATNINTLFIFGSKSPYYKEKDIIFIKNKFKKLRIIVIRNANHLIHIEKEKEFIHTIFEFLNQ